MKKKKQFFIDRPPSPWGKIDKIVYALTDSLEGGFSLGFFFLCVCVCVIGELSFKMYTFRRNSTDTRTRQYRRPIIISFRACTTIRPSGDYRRCFPAGRTHGIIIACRVCLRTVIEKARGRAVENRRRRRRGGGPKKKKKTYTHNIIINARINNGGDEHSS